MDPVGLTRFTTSKNSRLLLLLRKVMAVPLCPSRPALPTWMRENRLENIYILDFYFQQDAFIYNRLYVSSYLELH